MENKIIYCNCYLKGTEIEYKFHLERQGIFRLIFFVHFFTEEELAFIHELMLSMDYGNYKLAKAIIDNRNK